MQYTWTEKGTRFNGKDYQFTMYKLVDYDAVVVRCVNGSPSATYEHSIFNVIYFSSSYL